VKDELVKQERYFELGERYFWFSGHNAVVADHLEPELARLAGAGRRPLRIVDVGCGPGNMLRRFADWGDVVGLDYSLDALAFARGKGVRRVLAGDVTALPFATGSVDCVLALEVIEHCSDDAAALAEIARVLRPGGVLAVTVPAFMALWRYHDEAYGHCRRYVRGELAERVRRAGISVLACQYFKCAFFVPLWLLAASERLGVTAPRESWVSVPGWLNRTMAADIVWENRSGLAARAPFGAALLCVGRRADDGDREAVR
jgi:SAM-dependent methyltransferase